MEANLAAGPCAGVRARGRPVGVRMSAQDSIPEAEDPGDVSRSHRRSQEAVDSTLSDAGPGEVQGHREVGSAQHLDVGPLWNLPQRPKRRVPCEQPATAWCDVPRRCLRQTAAVPQRVRPPGAAHPRSVRRAPAASFGSVSTAGLPAFRRPEAKLHDPPVFRGQPAPRFIFYAHRKRRTC